MLKLKNYVDEKLYKNEYVKFNVESLRKKEIDFLKENYVISENNESIYITRDDNIYYKTEYGKILTREQVEECLEVLDLPELYINLHKKALENNYNGRAVAFLDLRDLTVGYEWLPSNTYNQDIDNWYKLQLCKVDTPFDIFDDEDFFTDDEKAEFERNDNDYITIQEYYLEKWGSVGMDKHIDDYLGYYSMDFDLDWVVIRLNLDEIYSQDLINNFSVKDTMFE